jgi:hypothetical protein
LNDFSLGTGSSGSHRHGYLAQCWIHAAAASDDTTDGYWFHVLLEWQLIRCFCQFLLSTHS